MAKSKDPGKVVNHNDNHMAYEVYGCDEYISPDEYRRYFSFAKYIIGKHIPHEWKNFPEDYEYARAIYNIIDTIIRFKKLHDQGVSYNGIKPKTAFLMMLSTELNIDSLLLINDPDLMHFPQLDLPT